MFIDQKTNTKIYADLDDSVSRATHRPFDLTHAFLPVIRDTPEYVQLIAANQPPACALDDADHEWWDGEDGSYFINESLWGVMESYAPEGYYFGAHEGDGSLFGYWKIENEF